MILAIDPGNEQSAYVVLDDKLKPVEIGKKINDDVFDTIGELISEGLIKHVVIEMVACYGMAVGKTVFETCVWIGRFMACAHYSYASLGWSEKPIHRMFRKDVKMNLCHNTRAKDSNVSQALRDRFGEKGTKANPGWFYGFKADIWQAYAVGVTYHDMQGGA